MFSNDQNIERIAQFVEESKRWLTLRADYARLSIVDKVVRIVTALVLYVVLFIVFMLFLTFISIAAAELLGGILDSAPLGYLIIGLAYLVLIFIIYNVRHVLIERPLITFLIDILAEGLNEEEVEESGSTASTTNSVNGKEATI